MLSTCAVLQDAYAPAQFEQVRSGDKGQGEPTVLKWRLESVFIGQTYFIATLSAMFVSKLRKVWKVYDFLSEIVLYKQILLGNISVR